ncbi:hypothetical protein M5689_011004 [Euphorbia peplus]|nr:hypothetical protein M5689_011004 [Euphorbia peplus]
MKVTVPTQSTPRYRNLYKWHGEETTALLTSDLRQSRGKTTSQVHQYNNSAAADRKSAVQRWFWWWPTMREEGASTGDVAGGRRWRQQ